MSDPSCPSCVPPSAICVEQRQANDPSDPTYRSSPPAGDGESTSRSAVTVSTDASDASNQELASLCKALGHPARVQILKILIARQSCICGEIVKVMPLAQSTVSEHLRILKQAQLVQGDVDGKRICYCVNPVVLDRLKCLINELTV